jgi:LysM repeat protein
MPMLKSMTRVIRVLLPAAAAVSVAGCSADVARFDSAGFTGSDNQQTSSIPIPPASVYSPAPRAGLLGEGDGSSHQPPPMADGSRGGDVRVAELPPTSNGYGQSPRSYDRGYDAPPARSYDRAPAGGYDSVSAKPYDAAPRARRPAEPRVETAAYSPASGDTVEVKPGDTLYSLSRQHGVKVEDIKSANNLKGHALKPGQRLTMPSASGANRADPISGAVTPPVADAAPVSTPAAIT